MHSQLTKIFPISSSEASEVWFLPPSDNRIGQSLRRLALFDIAAFHLQYHRVFHGAPLEECRRIFHFQSLSDCGLHGYSGDNII